MLYSRREIFFSALSFAAAGFTACGLYPGAEPDETRVFLIDVSASVRNPGHYISAFNRLLDCIEPGGQKHGTRVVAAFITENPASDAAFDLNEFLPAFDPVTGNALRHRAKLNRQKEEMKTKFRALFESLPKGQKTPLIESLDVAEKVFARYRGTKRRIIIMSDMKEDSDQAVFDAPAREPRVPSAKSLIERYGSGRRLPDISGAEVFVIGAEAATPALHRQIELFWREFFAALGARVCAYGYGLIDCL